MSNNKEKKRIYFGYQPKNDISEILKPPKGGTGEVDSTVKLEENNKSKEEKSD